MRGLQKHLTVLIGLIILVLFYVLGWLNILVLSNNYLNQFIPNSLNQLILILLTTINYSFILSGKEKSILKYISILIVVLCLFISFIEFKDTSLASEKIITLISPITIIMVIGANIWALLWMFGESNSYKILFKSLFNFQFVLSFIGLLAFIENVNVTNKFIELSSALIISPYFFILSLIQLRLLDFNVKPFFNQYKSSLTSEIVKIFIPTIIGFLAIDNFIESYFEVEYFKNGSYFELVEFLLFVVAIILVIHLVSLKMEKKLESSSSLAQSLYNNSLVGFYVTTPSGKILSANPALIEMLGYNSFEDLGTRVLTKNSYVDIAKRNEFINKMENEGMVNKYLSEWYTKSGEKLTVEESAIAIKNDKGHVIRYEGVVQNITERIRLEKERKEVQQELEDFFNYDISADFLISKEGDVLNCNKTFLELFEFESKEKATATNISQLYYNPHKRKKVLKELLKKTKLINKEISFKTTTNRKIYCLVNLVAVYNDEFQFNGVRGFLVDISDLKLAQLELKQNEERFRLASIATREIIWERDIVQNKIWRSDNFKAGFGWGSNFGGSVNEFLDQIHKNDIERVSNKIYNFLNSSDQLWEDEYRLLKNDGSYAWVFDRGYKLNDSQGNLLKVIGSMVDITNEYIQEKKLIESEEKYRKIVDNALVGVFETDINGMILFANQYIKEKSEFNNGNEITNVNIGYLYVHKEQHTKFMTELQTIGYVSNFEVAFYSKSKQIVQCLLSAHINDNKVTGMLLDITHLKYKETELLKLNQAIKQSPLSIIITNRLGEIEYCNPKVEELTGYSLKEVINKNPKIFSAAEHSITNYEELWETISNGDNWYGEFYNKKKNGEYFWEKASISPVFDSLNKISHFISIKEDITKEKKLISELIKSKEKAEESDRLKSAFLSNMSHEIRTPMNGILGFSDLLKTPDLSPDKQQKYIDVIIKSGNRMLSTINDIIDISKIEANIDVVRMEQVDLGSQLIELYSFFTVEASNKGIELLMSPKIESEKYLISSDSYKLYSILQNLLKNAVKFTHKGAVEIGLNINNEMITVVIKDSGIGIPKDRQPFIFDRFVQADIEDKNVYEGSGLGLAISKSYASMINGLLTFESVEGEGTIFSISLPYKKSTKSIDHLVEAVEFKGNVKCNYSILIIDDDDLSKMLLGELLQDFSATIFEASSGEDGIEILKSNPSINIILMDIKMPGIGGVETTRLIRKFNEKVIIIAQTAYAMEGDREDIIEKGFNEYISKPIMKDELINKIEQLMN